MITRTLALFALVCGLVVASIAVPAPTHAQVAPTVAPPEGYAQLIFITDFDQASIEINGVAYPYEWIFGDQDGVLVPADRYYEIVVSTAPDARRTFRLTPESGEVRVMVVTPEYESRQRSEPDSPAAARQADPEEEEDEEEDEGIGYLGVSSSPRGIVHVDGESTGQRTPARRIELEPGRHEVTVFYDEQEVMSEVKHVLIRQGVNTNVFFRMQRERTDDE